MPSQKSKKKNSNIVRAVKMFNKWFGSKIDERVTPEQQLIEAAEFGQQQHVELALRAGQVVGAARKMEMDCNSLENSISQKTSEISAGLMMQAEAEKKGDAVRYEELADQIAAISVELASDKAQLATTAAMLDSARAAAEQAKEVVVENKRMLRDQTAEVAILRAQAAQARMQDIVANSLAQISGMAVGDPNIPNIKTIRDSIEMDYANALGRTEIASLGGGVAASQMRRSALASRGEEQVAQIRRELESKGQLAITSGPADSDDSHTVDAETVEVVEEPKVAMVK